MGAHRINLVKSLTNNGGVCLYYGCGGKYRKKYSVTTHRNSHESWGGMANKNKHHLFRVATNDFSEDRMKYIHKNHNILGREDGHFCQSVAHYVLRK